MKFQLHDFSMKTRDFIKNASGFHTVWMYPANFTACNTCNVFIVCSNRTHIKLGFLKLALNVSLTRSAHGAEIIYTKWFDESQQAV